MLATTEDASYVDGKIVVGRFRLTVRIHHFFATAIVRFILRDGIFAELRPYIWLSIISDECCSGSELHQDRCAVPRQMKYLDAGCLAGTD